MTPTCITGSHRCPRTAACWRYNKPAESGQDYSEFPGGDDCSEYRVLQVQDNSCKRVTA